MAKNLVIVESPAKAKTIEKILGKGKYEVLASLGHVIDLPKTTIGIDIENGFKPKYMVIKDRKELLNALKEKAKKADKIFLASDPDREGEAISWHISNYINEPKKIKRIEFNEITKTAISKAIIAPRDINLDLVNSQQARRLLDRLVGYKISPLLWSIVGRNASAGRVQSVALKLISDLEDEIKKFVSQKYFEISININNGINLNLSEIKDEKIEKIFDENIFKKAVDDLKDQSVEIIELSKSKKSQKAPQVFKTSTLQQIASSYLGYNATKTMKIAQKLYEGINIDGEPKGLITYMRTDSTRVSDEAMKQASNYIALKYGKEYVGKYTTTSKKNIQDAHEGIRPSYIELDPESIKVYLSSEEYRLYKLIWDRFISSQFAAMKYEQLQIKAIKGDYVFKGNINKILFDGYYKITRDEDAIVSVEFPDLELNRNYDIEKLITKEGETKAPSRYTEATLIKKLESLGIGRPSTYASIIEAIKSKNYIEIVDKKINITNFGKEVKLELENNFKTIMNVKFTANMEDKLDEIAQGNLNWEELLSEFYNKLDVEMKEYKNKIDHIKNRIIYTDVECTKLNGKMILKTGNFGKYLVCEYDPNDKISIKDLEIDEESIKSDKIELKDKVLEMLENKKGIKTDVYTENNKMYYLKKGRFGDYLESEDYKNDNLRKSIPKEILLKLKKGMIKIENGILILNEYISKFEEDNKKILDIAGNCEKCNSNFVIKTGRYGKFLACSNYPECKNIKKIPQDNETKK